ncbi:hypothetical protein Tco_1351191 [Tanacetum coccineum]
MVVLESCPKHNMVAYLEKTKGNAEFHEDIDFLARSYIHHALTAIPVVSTTFVEQFWMPAKSKIINNVRYITAKVAGKSVSISEASIRSDLLFDDADGIDSLPNQTIFDALQLMCNTLNSARSAEGSNGAVEQHRLESRTFEVKINQVLSENERLLAQAIDNDIVKTVVNLSVNEGCETVNECQKCLELKTELLNKKDFLQSQAKDTVIVKLKEQIKSLRGNGEDSSVKMNMDEIETLNIELEHRVTKLVTENEHLKQTVIPKALIHTQQ